ncbi:MAG TPA: protein tyrosine phosphatase family protein [Candidatus Saccharimonadales bacterium]|nr:protein tyrosine phosphatase family protein [Candidatus Saccharimonadales bacterium]
MKQLYLILAVNTVLSASSFAFNLQQTGRERLEQIEQALHTDVPRILCISDSFATGGQPSEQGFSKLAANGFRSVLNLRTAAEGVDLEKERTLVEKSGMRYLHIPVVGSAPRAEQADEFIRVVKEKAYHPMLIHCGSANRVGAFMMIYRVVEQGWSEEKAEEEAVKIGLRSEELKKFAKDYIARQKAKRG